MKARLAALLIAAGFRHLACRLFGHNMIAYEGECYDYCLTCQEWFKP